MPQDASRDEAVPASVKGSDLLLPEINTGLAHPARVYDYMLGGMDNCVMRLTQTGFTPS